MTKEDDRKRINKALSDALVDAEDGEPLKFSDQYIIFSDHHKGARNRADDFLIAERAYNAALAYYYEMGHTLVVLGDAEELWEERITPVLRAYEYTLKLEFKFHEAGRYLRFWGNHDDVWQYENLVQRYLGSLYGNRPLKVREGLKIKVMDGSQEVGTLFLVHGHQGTLESDKYGRFAKLIVRYIWRPFQRITHKSLNTPAKDWKLRAEHDAHMYHWSEKQDKLVLIAGHTHRPVFKTQSHEDQIEDQLARLEEKIVELPQDEELRREMAFLRAKLEWVRAQGKQSRSHKEGKVEQRKPCYFNTGCCCFFDGDITGIEIASGEIRLVRWPNKDRDPEPHILARASLKEVFEAC